MALHRGRPLEPLEDPFLLLGQDALAGVPDLHAGAVLVGVQLDLDRTAAAELDRVGQQVGDHLADADAIPVADDFGAQPQQHRRARLGGRLAHQIDRLDHQRLQIDLLGAQLEPALDQPRDVEQLIDELIEADDLPPDGGQTPEHPIVGDGAPVAVAVAAPGG